MMTFTNVVKGSPAFAVMNELHMLLVGLLVFGALLLLIVLPKAYKADKLVSTALILVILGVLGVLLTAQYGLYAMTVMR